MPAGIRRKTRTYGGLYPKLGIGAALAVILFATSAWACDSGELILRDGDVAVRFDIELAATPQERGQGLMGRESMARNTGMLFVYDMEQPVAFWMLNTLIPLDMLFIKEDGTVVHIHENAIPHDLTPIPSPEPVRFVLEINGGLSSVLGIDAGAVIQHPAVPQDIAAFPCN